jgi:hypothetical protein
MNARIFLFGICALTLCACSSVNHLLTFEEEAPPAQIPASPEISGTPQPSAPVQGAPSEWCQRVAASDRQRAQQQGFDAATLDRMALQSLRQCVELGAAR